ncbi:MAG: hypothetical protein RLY86_3587 [Pseudomonadota bacterium]|jgi:lipopolysaccharide export system permease protein
MTQIGRYLLRNLTVATVFVTAGLSAAIWLTQSLRLVELVVEGGAPLLVFLQLALLTLPTFLSVVLPVGLIVAVLFTYNRLTLDSELVVMRSAGMGPMTLARPALTLGVLVSLACFALTTHIAPAAQRELVRLRFEAQSDYSAVLLREGTFNDVGEGLTVYVRDRERNGTLTGLLIHDTRTSGVRTTVRAERGQLLMTDDVPRVVVFNGTQMTFNQATGRQEWLEFARYAVDLQVLQRRMGDRWPDPRERGLLDLVRISDDPRDQGQADRLRAELHSRLATPFLPLAFAVIALACLLPGEFSRRGQVRRITLAAVLALLLQSAVLGLTNLVGKSPTLVPLLYTTVLLPVPLGVWYMKHWRRLRGRFRRPPARPAAAAE